jgi:hypothetical protein
MENNNKSVFERLDGQDTKLDIIIEQIASIKQDKKSSTDISQSTKPQINNVQTIDQFLSSSTKQHFWLGSNKDFAKARYLLIIGCSCLILFGIISTITTSLSLGMYSTYSLFENLWTIAACFILYYATKTEKKISDYSLSKHSNYIFFQDKYGVWVSKNKEKKRFKWTRRLSYLALVLNLISIWWIFPSNLAIIATLFELVFLGLTIGTFFLIIYLYAMYGNVVYFTGRNTVTNQYVTIVYDVLTKKLMTVQEYESQYKDIFFDV